jgi:hypothetical protein
LLQQQAALAIAARFTCIAVKKGQGTEVPLALAILEKVFAAPEARQHTAEVPAGVVFRFGADSSCAVSDLVPEVGLERGFAKRSEVV